MPEIHPTAILDGDVELADDVTVGPHCVIRGRVRIGAGTQLLGNVYLQGPLELGARNRLWPFVALGFAPQHLAWDPDRPGAGVVIGDENTFRESVTISRAASDERPTRVGNRNYWMANSHAGHDSEIGNGCVIANGTLLGGVVRLGDGAVTGGNSAVHQHCQVGRGALLSGVVGLSKDLPPFFMLTGTNIAGSMNVIGMRRSGMPRDQIGDVRWVYKTLYRRGLSLPRAIAELEQRKERPIVAEYLAFLAGSKRGLCPARGDPRRGVSEPED
jgi:UDP-N-acetylglucosamine acyltransferase